MPLTIFFWLLMVLWLLFGIFSGPGPFFARGNACNIIIFLLVGLLGWQIFGPALK